MRSLGYVKISYVRLEVMKLLILVDEQDPGRDVERIDHIAFIIFYSFDCPLRLTWNYSRVEVIHFHLFAHSLSSNAVIQDDS